ncbi:hypothetical protein GH714_001056 [Hevea brasiliensis]|uniref:Fe2OG dioxygenase domain-containing protein n=1 Tax=Hevea brasiliensis TaxID=3981 RepID=A0A6A6L5N5_HEVBR|nr:hypothetical protein GH714_001056 [Hevea brasiliensis]
MSDFMVHLLEVNVEVDSVQIERFIRSRRIEAIGVVKSKRSIWRLKTVPDFFWAIVNFIGVFFATMFSMEKSTAYRKGSGSGKKWDGGPGGPGSGPYGGGPRGTPRGLDNVPCLRVAPAVVNCEGSLVHFTNAFGWKCDVERVQGIASTFRDNIPEAYIRSEQEQPALTTVHGLDPGVQVIDMSDPDQEKVHGLIINASQEWGMFQIINHGIPSEVIIKLQNVGKEFLSFRKKRKKFMLNHQGLRKAMEHFFKKKWRARKAGEANEDYAKHLNRVADKLLKTLSLGLGLKEHELKEAMGGENLQYLLKINYYPPCPRPDLALGVVAHTDMSSLTILVPNDVQGLQASRDGKWYGVKYIPNALVIHIGDQLEILSNGKYKSVLHRTTVNKEKARMSWPVFLEPPFRFTIGPHPKLVNGENPAKYTSKKFDDYCYCKLNKIPQ